MEELKSSILQYNEQLRMVAEALQSAEDRTERKSLVELQSELQQLIQLTQESLDAAIMKESNVNTSTTEANSLNGPKCELDDEYALFMQEMTKSGAFETENQVEPECSKSNNQNQVSEDNDSDIEPHVPTNPLTSELLPLPSVIEQANQNTALTLSHDKDELASLLGMKCAVYHTHKWGGQPSLHNAMVSSVLPRQDDDKFKDLQVRVLFTHPTHSEMLPCPFYLDGECKFDDEKCRYSHGAVVPLSNLKEAIEPNFDTIKIGSRILLKLKPPDDEDISITKRSTEKYHLWHRAIVTHVDSEKRVCSAKLEHGSGDKRKATSDELIVHFEELFPLNTEGEIDSDTDDSLSDTEYPQYPQSSRAPAPPAPQLGDMGQWERHTRGIGSKLMLAMGYIPGQGLGSTGAGRVRPVEARVVPLGRSLDHCMAISERAAGQDPLKVEQKLKRLQKKEEERNKRAYDREKEKEKRNVFNFLNRTLGDRGDDVDTTLSPAAGLKQSTSKDLNIEQFKITEDTRRLEKEIQKLNSLARQPAGSPGHRAINIQISEKNKELNALRNKEQLISKEQRHRKDKQKMTVF